MGNPRIGRRRVHEYMVEDVSEERSPTWTPLAAKVICAGGEGGRSGGGISSISSFGGTGVFDMLNTGKKQTQTINYANSIQSFPTVGKLIVSRCSQLAIISVTSSLASTITQWPLPSSATSCNLGMNLCDFLIKNDVVVRSRVPQMKRTGKLGLRLEGRSSKRSSV